MQKILFFLSIGLVLSLTACEKTYVCTCVTVEKSGTSDPVTITTEYTGTERFAEDECATGNVDNDQFKTTCRLD